MKLKHPGSGQIVQATGLSAEMLRSHGWVEFRAPAKTTRGKAARTSKTDIVDESNAAEDDAAEDLTPVDDEGGVTDGGDADAGSGDDSEAVASSDAD